MALSEGLEFPFFLSHYCYHDGFIKFYALIINWAVSAPCGDEVGVTGRNRGKGRLSSSHILL